MKVISSGVVAGIAAAALVALSPAAHAVTTHTVTVRQGDFIAGMSDTRTTGHEAFLKEGLHVWTDGVPASASSNKAAEYFAVAPQSIPGSASLTWYGTQPQPGSQIVFDADGDATTTGDGYNVLVGEPAYNGDYWLTNGSSAAAHAVCPETTGGSGSACHGTLAEWQHALPDASVWAVGFSLGSGIQGDGVIHDIQVGDTDYQFTSDPAVTTVPVTGTATANEVVRAHSTTLSLSFRTDALGANQVVGKKLTFKVTDNDEVVFRDSMGAAEKSSVKLHFAEGSGKHKVQILKNGVVDRTFKINMGH